MSRNTAKPKASRKRNDREKLELFLKLMKEMRDTSLAKKGFSVKHSYRWNKSDGILHVDLEQPDEDDLRSFLLTLRKILSKNEDAYIQTIHRIFYKRVKRDDMRQDLGAMNSEWRTQLANGGMNINLNGRKLPPEYVVEVWLNGKYFHDDIDYAQELNQLETVGLVGSTLHRVQFLNAILSTANYALWLASNLDYCLNQDLLDFDNTSSVNIVNPASGRNLGSV
jgi:hypothetical protein